MSLGEFSHKCGIPKSTIKGYLDGSSEPRFLENLKKIAKACDTEVGWLAAGEEPKEVNEALLENPVALDEVQQHIYKRRSDNLDEAMRLLVERLMILKDNDLDGFCATSLLVNERLDKLDNDVVKKMNEQP